MHAAGAVTILRRPWEFRIPRGRQLRRPQDATSANKTTNTEGSEVGVTMAGKPRGAASTSARKMGEEGRLAQVPGTSS